MRRCRIRSRRTGLRGKTWGTGAWGFPLFITRVDYFCQLGGVAAGGATVRAPFVANGSAGGRILFEDAAHGVALEGYSAVFFVGDGDDFASGVAGDCGFCAVVVYCFFKEVVFVVGHLGLFAVGGGDFCEIAVCVVLVAGGSGEDVVFGGNYLDHSAYQSYS